MKPKFFSVVMCGGSGTRLWPMSRRQYPKQFLSLMSEDSLLQQTVLRLRGLADHEASIVVSNREHRFLVAEQLQAVNVQPAELILEPVSRNTAPAVAVAAMAAQERDADAVLLVLPSDLFIEQLPAFHASVQEAFELAQAGKLVTFGVKPRAPETGYGYIEAGESLGTTAHHIRRFVEKPNLQTAVEYLATGRYYWNSGMFVFRAQNYLHELEAQRPQIFRATREAWQTRRNDGPFTLMGAEAFEACPSESMDYAVMEHARNAAMVVREMGWSDVGSWNALWEAAEKDANGNVVRGDVDVSNSKNVYVRAESKFVSVSGVRDVVLVETADSVLLMHREESQSVKDIVSRLESASRTEHLLHPRVYRPWGYYECLDSGACFQVKRLMLKPGHAISLQLHRRRAEHWVVVSGTAKVTRGEEVFELCPNQSTYIPIGTRHRLENAGEEPLFVVEVQSGDYLGEDDITRFEDLYNRTAF